MIYNELDTDYIQDPVKDPQDKKKKTGIPKQNKPESDGIDLTKYVVKEPDDDGGVDLTKYVIAEDVGANNTVTIVGEESQETPKPRVKTRQPVKKVDTRTEEQKKADLEEAEKKAQEMLRSSYERVRTSKVSGVVADPKDEQLISKYKGEYRKAVKDALTAERNKLYEQGYTPEAIEKRVPSNPKAGLFNSYEQNQRLVANGLNKQAMNPEYAKNGIINGFSSSAYLKVDDLEGYAGAELRRKASKIFFGYLGFDEETTDSAIKAWELNNGNEQLFVSLNSGKPIDSVIDLYQSGDVVTGDDGDVTVYKDSKAELIEYGLIAKALKRTNIEFTPENIAIYTKKYQDLLEKRKQDDTKELREYAEKHLQDDQRWAVEKLLDGALSIFSGIGRDESVGNRGDLIREVFGDEYVKSQEVTSPSGEPFSGTGRFIVPDAELDEIARQALAVRNYKIQLSEDSMFQALANIPNADSIELVAPVLSYVMKSMYPEKYKAAMKDASKYTPSIQELGGFSAQLGTVLLGSAVGGGVGATLATLALAEKSLRDSNPDTYNLNMAVQVIPVGIGNALNFAKPIIGSTASGSTQIALGAGQTIASYGINLESFRNEKGELDISRIFPELVLDIASSGLDAPDFIQGIKAKQNPIPHQVMNLLMKTEYGDYAMFVKNRDSGVFQLVPVKPEKAEAWANKQKESGKAFIERVMPVSEYNSLLDKFGNESVLSALNHALFGDTNKLSKLSETPVLGKISDSIDKGQDIRKLSQDFEKNTRTDSKQKIVDGEVQVTDKVSNPRIIVTEEGAVPVNIDARVSKRLADTDENRDFSVLNILANYGITLNKNSNIIGDGKLADVLTGLKENEYITIDSIGNIKATQKGIELTEKLNLAGESFQKFVDRNVENYGSKFDAESISEVTSAMKDNRFFSASEKPFSYSIQDIMGMGQKQKEALAMKVAMGKAEFNKETGVLKNTPFTLKNKDGSVRNFGSDGDAFVRWKTAKMEKAFSKGNDELGNAIAKDILDFQGKNSDPDSIKKFVEGDPEAEEVKPTPVGSVPERSMGRKQAPETLVVEDSLGHRRYFSKNSSGKWTKSGQSDQVFGGAYLKGLVDSGEWTLIGEAPRSWSETRDSTKKNYKKSSSAVKQSRIPETLTREEADRVYADEGDVYNVAVWNQTAKEWREANPDKAKGGKNMRDYATVEELEVLDALEVKNSDYMKNGIDLPTRVIALNREAIKLARMQEARKSVQKKLAIPEKLSTKNKEKEVKALSELFSDDSDAAKGKYEELAKAIRSEDDITASQILKDLVPESDNPTATLGRFYQESRNILQTNDFAMQADSIPNKIRNLLGLPPKSKLGLTLLDHQKNYFNWVLTGGEIKLDPKTKIDISNPEWDADSAPHFEKSKADDGVIYVNNKLLSGLREAQGQSTGIYGLAFKSGADLSQKLDTYFPNNRDFQALKGAVKADQPFVLIKVDSQNMSYENFLDAVAHEGTHKLVIETVGGTKLFNDEHVLSNIFNHADGQVLGKAVRNNSIYSGRSMNDVAHEVLAYATNPDTLGGLGIKTIEEAQAFARTYARLLNAIEDSYGKDAVKVITKFQEQQTKDTIRLIRENERRIRQNQLQKNTEGLNISEGERSGQIRGYDDGTSQQGFASTTKQFDRLEGTGIKRLKVRRFTRDGNPFSLTNVEGAEKSRRIREGAKPTFNFYVMREDGTFVIENDFKGSKWISYDVEIEGNFADLAKEPELLKLYRETPFSRFQSVMEDLGYNGVFYYDSFNQGDVFNYRLQLFDNDINRQMIQSTGVFEMDGQRKKLANSEAWKKWAGDTVMIDEDGLPILLAHGTISKIIYDTPDVTRTPKQLGFHLGTIEQSNKFVINPESAEVLYPKVLFPSYHNESDPFGSVLSAVKVVQDRIVSMQDARIIPYIKGETDKLSTENFNSYFNDEHYGRGHKKEDVLKQIEEMRDGYANRTQRRDRIDIYTANFKNPVIMEDLGAWYPIDIIYQLKEIESLDESLFNKMRHEIRDLSPEDKRKSIVKFLTSMGYDSVKYWNKYEGEGWSYIALDANQLRSAFDPEFADPMVDRIREQEEFMMAKDSTPEQRTNNLMKYIYNTPPKKLGVRDVSTLVRDGFWSTFTSVKGKDASNQEKLKDELIGLGYKVIEVDGRYSGVNEPAFMVYYQNPNTSRIIQALSNKYDQESALHGKAGQYWLEYQDGSTRPSNIIAISGVNLNRVGVNFQKQYAEKMGLKVDPESKKYLDAPEPKDLKAVADEYMSLDDAPDNLDVAKAYNALISETGEQYKTIFESGIKIEAWESQGEPYKNSKAMLDDISKNNHYYYLKTEESYGSGNENSNNLMLTMSELKDSNGRTLPNNDVFRIVHDLMGHTGNEWQFGIRGEWNAFVSHSDLYSRDALPALMAETFMQNAVVSTKNYKYEDGKYILNVAPDKVEFAPQKNIIPSDKTIKKVNSLIKSTDTFNKQDGTFIKLKDGTVRFSIDFDWSDEAVVPRATNYDLEPAVRRIQVRDELKNSDILTPDQMSRIWNGEAELVDAKGDKIDLNMVYDSTGRTVGKVEIDDTGQEYVMDGKTKVNLVNGTGKRGVTNYYIGKTGRDSIATTAMFQQLVKLYSPYDQPVKPDNPDDIATYNAQRSEIYKANIKSILDQYSKSHESEMGGLWYKSGIDELALKVGKDIKVVGTDIGKLWLALVTAVTSPNTSVQANAGYALNALSSIFRYYESGELVIPKFQMDNQGNYIIKADGTPKKLGLGSTQLEKIEMLIKGYIPADTAEGWSQYYANGGKIDTVTGRDILGENSIAPRAKYVKSATASEMMDKYGSLNGVINFLLSESVDGKKFNKAVDILGDKLGAFFSNIAGQTQIPTIDTWMNRYFMGLTGEALEITRDKNGNITKLKDNSQNFDPRDGDFFRANIQKAVQEWNAENDGKLTPADAQAIIWTQIKHLFNSIAEKESANIDFSQAYDKIRMQKATSQPLLPMFGDAEFKSEMPKAGAFDIDPSDINPKYLDPKFGENYFIEQDTGMTFAMAEQSPFETTTQRLDLSDELLKEGDIDTWTSLANMLVQGGLHNSEEAKLTSYLNKGDIEGAKKYILSLNKMGVTELFVNIGRISLLLGVKNITKNVFGNSLKSFMEELSSLPTSLIDLGMIQVNKLAGGDNFDRASISLLTDPAESLRMYKEAFGTAFTKGLKDSKETFLGKQAANFEHPQFSRERTTGWRFLKPLEIFEKYGWRFQGALDRPFNAYAYKRSISELQTLRQKQQIKAGNKISYEEAIKYLTPQDYEIAEYRALAASYQEHNMVANKYYSMVEGMPPFWRAVANNIFKFVKTPLNVVDYILDYTGLWQIAKLANNKSKAEDFTGWKSEVKKMLDNPQDRLAISKAISQGMIGSVMIHIGFRMAQEGIIQGFYDPDERKEQDIMEAKNISYGSVQIGGKNVDISWLSPVSFYLLSGGSMFHDGKKYSEKLKQAEDKLQQLIDSEASENSIEQATQDLAKLQNSNPSLEVSSRILKNLALQTPFIRQGYDLVKASERDKLGEGLLNMLVQPETFVPAIVKEIAETADPTGKVIRDDSWIDKATDKTQAKVPTVPVVKDIGKALEDTNIPVVRGVGKILKGREALPIKYDMLGRPIETPYGLDPFRVEEIDNNDPVLQELDRLKVTIPKPFKGTATEKNEERKIRGDFYRPQLEKIVNSVEYINSSDTIKKETIIDAMRYLSSAKKTEAKEEYVNHKIDLIRDVNFMIGDMSNNPSKYGIKEVTDKESVMHIHRANIDPKKLNAREIVNSMKEKELDKFFNDMFRYNFEPSETRTLEESKANYEKFKSNPNEFIVQQYIRDLEYADRKKRLANWRKELKDAGKTDKEIESEIRSRSSKLGKQTGYKYRKSGKITIPESLAEKMISNQRPSENIEDIR